MQNATYPVRLARCTHGTYFLTAGSTTLTLTQDELVLIGRAIYGMAERHAPLLSSLIAAIRAEQMKNEAAEKAAAPFVAGLNVN